MATDVRWQHIIQKHKKKKEHLGQMTKIGKEGKKTGFSVY
jgi:hypothetical protein